MDRNTVILTLDYLYVLESQQDCNHILLHLERELASLWRDHRLEYGQKSSFISHLIHSGTRMIDNIQPLRAIISTLNNTNYGGYIDINEPKMSGELLTIIIKGSTTFVEMARTKILASYNIVVNKDIPLSSFDFQQITSNREISPIFLEAINSISNTFDIEYVISTKKIDYLKNNSTNFKLESFNLDYQNNNKSYNIYLLGNQDNVTAAETQLRVLINTVLNGFYVDTYNLDLSLIPLLGGVDMLNFTQIAKQLDCNIYIPDLLPELFNSGVLENTKNMKIYITSKDISSIKMAKYYLDDLVSKTLQKQGLITRSIPMFKTKLDLILLLEQAQVLSIMFKYGVFVQLPSLGSNKDFDVKVQGHLLESVEGAVHDLCLLSSQFYQLAIKFDQLSIANSDQFDMLLSALASNETKSSVISSNSNGINVVGTFDQIKNFVILLDTNFLKHYSAYIELSFSLEIDVEHKDFISGKKNGKIVKILNQLNQVPIIEFTPFNERNFLFNFVVNNKNQSQILVVPIFLKGLELISLELPAELTFNIPEVFHKSIIGNGGSIIQSIMKKYNVFIKFTSHKQDSSENDRELQAKNNKLHYTFQRFDNVLIKCPQKNAKNIPLVKSEVDELVRQLCLSNVVGHSFHVNNNTSSTTYLTTHFRILKAQYLLFVKTHNLIKINQIESETNTFIDFPKSIEDFENEDSITFIIKGSDNKSRQAAQKLTDLLPKTYRITLAQNPGKFDEFLSGKDSSEFKYNIAFMFKMVLGMEISTFQEGGSPIETPKYHLILLHYYDDFNLDTGIKELTAYLRTKNFLILDKSTYQLDNIVDTPRKLMNNGNNAGNLKSKDNTLQSIHSGETKKLKSITNTTASYQQKNNGLDWKSKRKSKRNNNHNQTKLRSNVAVAN